MGRMTAMLQRGCGRSFRLAGAVVVLMSGVLLSASAQATELSLVSGLYRGENNKVNGASASKKSTIDLGARLSQPLDGHIYWYGGAQLAQKTYDRGDAPKAPSDSSSIALSGGIRYYFNKLSENVSPYAEGGASFKDVKDATISSTGFDETESSGLYYSAAFGMRLNLQKEFFVDLASQLFESALMATDKVETTTYGQATTTKVERRRNELYVSSFNDNAFAKVTVALGMRF